MLLPMFDETVATVCKKIASTRPHSAAGGSGFQDPAIMAFNPLPRSDDEDDEPDSMGNSIAPPGFAPPPGFEPRGFFEDVARIGTSQQA